MIYLIYWYGSRSDSEYYGFVSRSNMVSYREEADKGPLGIHALLSRIRQKVESGDTDKLLPKEEDILRTYQEMEEDLRKEPADRKRGVMSFQEGYEMLSIEDVKEIDLDGNDDSSDGDDNDEDDDSSDSDDQKADPPTIKQKKEDAKSKPVSKKQKKPSTQQKEDDAVSDVNTEQDVSDAKALSKKKVKKASNERKKSKDDAMSDLEDDSDKAKLKPLSKKLKKPSVPRKKMKEDANSDVAAEKDEVDLKPESRNRLNAPIPLKKEMDFDADIKDLTSELTSPHPESPPPVKKKRGRPPKLVHHVVGIVHEDSEPIGKKVKKEIDTQLDADTKTSSAQKEETIPPAPKAMGNDLAAVLSDDIGDEEEDSLSGDEESSAAVENDDEDEEDDDDRRDHDFEENTEKSHPTKTGKPKEKVRVVKKFQKVKTKIDLPKTEKQLKRLETEAFMRCETLYARLVRKWHAAIQKENLERLRRVLTEAHEVVEDFSYSFILSYDLSNICKNSKKVLKSANEDLAQFTALKEKIRTTFESKKQLVPKSYVPKKPQYTFKFTASATEPKATTPTEMDSSEQGKKPKVLDIKASRNDMATKSLSQNSLDAAAHPPSRKGMAGAAGKSVTTGESMVEGSMAHRPAASAPKPERKKFLLGSLMQPRSSSQGTSQVHRGEETKAAAETALVPLWVTGPSSLDAPTEDPRRLALEFLLQMASHFPDGSVHVDSLARSLESAVYHWATNMSTSDVDSWMDKYWSKIHSLVAGLCGKVEKGTLQDVVLQGRFDTPDKLVGLSDDKFVASFEGKAVTV
jgi:hypothetical protein